MSSTFPATLQRQTPVSDDGVVMELDAPAALRQAHTRPGQYVVATLDGASAPFALLSVPGAERLLLFVRRRSALTVALAALPEGAPVTLTAPKGPGFPVERLQTAARVALVGAGTGVGPLLSLASFLGTHASPSQHRQLLWGARSSTEFSLIGHLGTIGPLEVLRVVSGPESGWSGPRGHTDTLYPLLGTSQNLDLVVCGPQALLEGIQRRFPDLAAQGRIHTNLPG